jgi:hypothetical protein
MELLKFVAWVFGGSAVASVLLGLVVKFLVVAQARVRQAPDSTPQGH